MFYEAKFVDGPFRFIPSRNYPQKSRNVDYKKIRIEME